MSLLEKASLIVTPNAYKESILYSVVPNTTLGDMTVVRATTATRVNSSGLIEVVPRNLLTYSNDFTNVTWVNGGYGNLATVTPNNIISPDGLMNGSKIQFTAGATQGRIVQQTTVVNGSTNSVSVYVKKGNKSDINISCDLAVLGLSLTFNFDTLALTNNGVSNSSATSVGNGWYLIKFSYVAPSVTSQIGFLTYNGEDGYIYAYGMQLDASSTATEYFPTTTRLNIPRIDYTNGSCPSLLVEPQRTNLLTYSNTFTNAAWDKGITTINANVIISPDGTLNASKLSDTLQGNNAYRLYNSVTLSAQSYTQTFYAKAAEYNWCYVRIGNDLRAWFNVSNGTIGQVASGLTGSIISVGNGWYKITCTITTASAGGGFALIGLTTGDNIESYTPTTGGKGIYIYGAQLEAGSYATSYIPTVASTVTRNADVISKTGISSLIGTEFTLFLDAYETIGGNSSRYLVLKGSGGTYANAVLLEANSSNQIVLTILNSSSGTVFGSFSSALTNGQRFKLAVRCKNNDFAYYVNGVLKGSQASGTVPITSDLYLGYYTDYSDNYNKINSTGIFNTGLTDAECIALTTL